MPSLLVLYPAYGTISCARLARYASQIEDLHLMLADESVNITNEETFDEIVELPPPERLAEAYGIMRRWCDRRRPNGIFMQSERGLLLGSLLAQEFGLRGAGLNAAHLCSNKYLQRTVLTQAGISNPRFSLAENVDDVRRLAADYGFPIVLKCVISTMSRLVTPVYCAEDIDNAVAKVRAGIAESLDVERLVAFSATAKVDLACDPRRQFLVESFLTGDLVETDGMAINGKPLNFGVSEQIQSVDPPFFIEAYLLPAECADEKPIEAVSDAIIKAIDLRDSGFSTEMRVCGDQVYLVEVNGRLGWDEGLSEIFAVRTRQERILQTAQVALGIEPDRTVDKSYRAALAYRPCYYDGVVEDLPTRDELAELAGEGLHIELATHIGARYYAPPNPETYPHVAWALAVHPTSSHAAYEKARQALDRLNITIRRL